jgi:hypothetical protein
MNQTTRKQPRTRYPFQACSRLTGRAIRIVVRPTCRNQLRITRSCIQPTQRIEKITMTVSTADYIRIADRAAELGCNMPTGFAIMPENLDTAATRGGLIIRGEGSTIRKLLKNRQLPVQDFLPSGERPGFVHNKSHDWAAFIFISAALLSNDPSAVSVALSVISNYLTDMFKGTPDKKIKLYIAVERKGDYVCKKLTYEGDAAGLAEIADAILRIGDE